MTELFVCHKAEEFDRFAEAQFLVEFLKLGPLVSVTSDDELSGMFCQDLRNGLQQIFESLAFDESSGEEDSWDFIVRLFGVCCTDGCSIREDVALAVAQFGDHAGGVRAVGNQQIGRPQ